MHDTRLWVNVVMGHIALLREHFYYSEYPFEKKASLKKNRYSVLSHQQRPSIHQAVVLEHSFLFFDL